MRAGRALPALVMILASGARGEPSELSDRVGVNTLEPVLLPAAAERLSIGWYKDYQAFGASVPPGPGLAYVPVLVYQGKLDSRLRRVLLPSALALGLIAPAPRTAEALLDELFLGRLEQRLARSGDRFPPGTLFQLGVEPGYAPNADDRSPEEVVADARAVRGALDRQGRGYRLALGGISTSRGPAQRSAYGGIDGFDYWRAVLERSDTDLFDAFVIRRGADRGRDGRPLRGGERSGAGRVRAAGGSLLPDGRRRGARKSPGRRPSRPALLLVPAGRAGDRGAGGDGQPGLRSEPDVADAPGRQPDGAGPGLPRGGLRSAPRREPRSGRSPLTSPRRRGMIRSAALCAAERRRP